MSNQTMKKILVLLSAIIFTVVACKKSAPATSNTTNNNNNTISPSNATSWYGLLFLSKAQNYTHGIMQSIQYGGNAYFSSTPNSWGDPSTAVMVDTIRLNGIPMMYFSAESMYYDTIGFFSGNTQAISYPYTYKVVGNNGIPSFTYTENGPFPAYTGYTNIPDTIYKSAGVTIQLTGISNADNVSVSLNDGTSGTGHEIGQQLPPPIPASVNFSASTISQFNVTNNAQIQISLTKMDIKSVYGKPMNFSTSYNFTKTVSVK